jgi:hypothetical protein
VLASSLFFEKKMDRAKGRYGKKEVSKTKLLPAIRTLCFFNARSPPIALSKALYLDLFWEFSFLGGGVGSFFFFLSISHPLYIFFFLEHLISFIM